MASNFITESPTFTVYKNNITSNDQENIYETVNEVDPSDSDSKTSDTYYTIMNAQATLPQEKFELFVNPIYSNSTQIPQSQEVSSSFNKTRKLCILIFGIIVAVSLMLSAAALIYSVLHKEKANVETLTSQVALLQFLVSMVNTDISAIQMNITSLTSRATDFENRITTTITDMGTRINSRVNFYRNCYKDVASCTVIQHSLSTVWYLCNTPYRSVNITVSYNIMKLLIITTATTILLQAPRQGSWFGGTP